MGVWTANEEVGSSFLCRCSTLILDTLEAMSAPMGVPTQRLGSSKSSSTRRQGPVAISRSSKMQQKAPPPSRTHSDVSPSKLSSVSTVLRRINSSAAAVDNPVATPVGSRKIATNSRIKKDEQNRRDMYLAFINNALKAKSEVSKFCIKYKQGLT
jgi:hypothetical protein